MIDSLNEINRLLIAVSELSHSDHGALKTSVINLCRDQVIEGKFPNHDETIAFSKETGIIREEDGRLKTTDLGKRILQLNRARKYELNDEQRELLVREVFLDGALKSTVLDILKKFSPAYSSKTFEWSAMDNPPLEDQAEFFELMRQSGLLSEKNSKVSIDCRYVDLVKELRRKPGVVSPEDLFKRLKNAEICGNIAETVVLDFEIARLNRINCMTEAECIQKISDLDCSAGYDIASFDGQTVNLTPNRFIEVKGSTGTEISFYWTRNEIKQAEILRSKYWIYFVPLIDLEKKNSIATPVLIQDPFKTVLDSEEYLVDGVEFFVRKR